ncbi:oligosaccharide flippase family protein [Chryseobacterium sp. Leaf394]|uniref:oligosaccharide flippase family protein n=1 Tax=Chryseobacterium sp. Leaf394 TaxID=1736361 RepID=UPI0006FB41C8|nr:oligosaccharide flippase family protein [Chryseobacterium sp. Leaf394]KQS93205.1 hypothetical protein ASG21_12510 [Chryseobacterium sp. Leaf394]
MKEEKTSHKGILRATSIVGGSQIIVILIGLIRTKFIAVLLGPAGIGINGILQNTVDLVRQATSFGINFSGVKDIAAANATQDQIKIGRTITVLRRWALYTGLLGMLMTIILSLPLSYFAFDSDKYVISIAVISVTLLISSISSGQIALLQGLRQIGTMARVSVLSAGASVIVTIPLYWWLGLKGIVPGIIISSVISLLISYLFTYKVKIIRPNISLKQTYMEGLNMARLGFYIIVTGLVVTITMYAIRSIIAQKLDLNAVGCFVAVWTISNTYVNIILSSMLSDFFPRLTAVESLKDNLKSNLLINEQLDMALVIATPLIIFLIAFAKFVIKIMFSSSFLLAVPVLQYQLLAGFIAIISWALGVMFLVKNKGMYSLYTESIWSIIYLLFVWFFWDALGFISLGVGCLVAHVVKLGLVYIITKKLGNFNFNREIFKTILTYSLLVIIIFFNVIFLQGFLQYFFSSLIIIISLILSFNKISKIIDLKMIINNKLKKNL